MKKNKRLAKNILSSALLLLILPITQAAIPLPVTGPSFDQILVNSNNWQDVYYGLLFAELTGTPGDFLLIPELAPDVVQSLSPARQRVLLIEPARQRQYPGLRQLLEEEGFIIVDVPGTGDYGYRLLDMIEPKGIMMTDARYPYNAVSLAPYALQQQSFVLFPEATSLDQLTQVLDERDVPLTAYGILGAAIQQAIEPYNPLIIDKGGKFDNNIYLVEQFLSEQDIKQVVLTNGEFIETSLITDFNPVLFIGRSNVPDNVKEFLGESDMEVAVVVGNYLSDVASDLKRTLKRDYGKDVSFIVKFAKTPRVLTAQFTTPTALEYFSLPIINPELIISSIVYNQLTEKLEVTYENPSLITAFFIASHTITADGSAFSIGDEDPQMIPGGQQKTFLYDLDVTGEDISVDSFVVYGDYPKSLEYSYTQSFTDIPFIRIADYAELDITKVVYDKLDDAFYITLHNPGDVPTYANVELVDIIVDGLPTTLGTLKVALLEPGASKQVYVRAKLTSLDILENENVLVRASYGQREEVLFKQEEASLPLKTRLIKESYFVAAGAVLILAILIFFLLKRKKTYECDRCGHIIKAKKSPRRHSCGGTFKKA